MPLKLLLFGICLLWTTPGLCQSTVDGYFVESGGVLVIEAESFRPLPELWADATTTEGASNINDASSASGSDFIVWQGRQYLNAPGNGELVFWLEINNPGLYRFDWRNQVGLGTNTTDHNDTWLKIDADAFFGEKGDGSSVVCPKGFDPSSNDCVGGEPNGSGSEGWFKVFSSGANTWRWSARTSDRDGHLIYARFDRVGFYPIRLSARSSFHVIDRIVLYSEEFSGDPQSLRLPVSEFRLFDLLFSDSFER